MNINGILTTALIYSNKQHADALQMCMKMDRRVTESNSWSRNLSDDGKAESAGTYAVLCSVNKKSQKNAPNITYSCP